MVLEALLAIALVATGIGLLRRYKRRGSLPPNVRVIELDTPLRSATEVLRDPPKLELDR